MNKSALNCVIITAGGRGTRLKSKKKKQFLEICDRPILFWTIDKFIDHDSIDKVILVFPKEEIEFGREIVANEFKNYTNKFIFTIGGKERQNSVFNGLKACPTDTELVLIHDGVRPFIKKDDIDLLMETANTHGAAIPGCPVKHTIKQIENKKVTKTLKRDTLVNVFTPQVFNYSLIMKLHEKARKSSKIFTDDAGILEHYNYPVFIAETDNSNIKITDKMDLIIAEYLIKKEIGE